MSMTLHSYLVWTLWFVTQIMLQKWCWMAPSAIRRHHATSTWFFADGCSGENQLPYKKFNPRNYHTGVMSWGHSGQRQLWPCEWAVWTFRTARFQMTTAPADGWLAITGEIWDQNFRANSFLRSWLVSHEAIQMPAISD